MAGRFSQWLDLAKIAASNRVFIGLASSAELLMNKRLQLLEIGDDAAQELGVNAESSRMWLMLFGVTLTAAAAGPISFIALAAIQIARLLTGLSSVTLT